MADKTITHPGYIKTIKDKKAEVVIISKSGCASCQINKSCGVSDMAEKIIEVELTAEQNYKVGDNVTVIMKQSQGNWAVLLGYVFPFLVVLIGLITFTNLGYDQAISGLISLSLMIPYYAIIYLLRNTLKKNFSYQIS